MTLILDTHVLLWWLAQPQQLSTKQRRVLQRAGPDKPVHVADISLWEIAMLHSLGRVRLELPIRDWLERATAPPLVQRIGISPAIAAEVAALPASFHRDPADRIIVSTARVYGSTLLTRDRRIIDAALVNTLE